jgi:hypothetical protein
MYCHDCIIDTNARADIKDLKMANKEHEQQEIIEVLSGSRRLDWHQYMNLRQDDIRAFKDQYGDGDGTDEKFFAKHELRNKQEMEQVRAWCQELYPEHTGYVTPGNFDITILITPRK